MKAIVRVGYFLFFTCCAVMMLSVAGCPGTVDRVGTAVGGKKIEEVRTENLLCGVVQHGASVSISCVKEFGN